MIGGPLSKKEEEQEAFMAQAILNPLEPFNVETQPLPQTTNESELFDDFLPIYKVRTAHKCTNVKIYS